MDELIPVFKEIVFLMPKEFDAHDFILQLIKNAPVSYFSILRSADNNVALANAQISNHLKTKASYFHITYDGKVTSLDVYQIPNECARFHK